MQLGIESHIPDGLLAANALLAENSRQGVPTSTQALHPGFGLRISSTAMDFQFRCSEIVSGTVVAPSNPCANATLAATGVNAQQAIAQANKWTAVGALIGALSGSSFTGALAGYGALVKTGGPQDFKNQPGPGTFQQRVDAGNISFGITCPFGGAFCQFAAGAAQTLAGHPDPNGTLKTGFDTPSDNASIRQGQAMRAAGCHG